MDNKVTLENYLAHIQLCLLAEAAEGAAYESWTDAFARKQIRDVWKGKETGTLSRRITIEELRAADPVALTRLGFGRWDENQWLVPLWVFNYIQDGEELISITDESGIKGKDDIDLDVRFGCIAWGWKVQE